MQERLEDLTAALLRGAAPSLLDAPLDDLGDQVRDDEVRALFTALFEAGEARALRDAIEEGSLLRFVRETSTEREEQALCLELSRWLGKARGGPDDPARLVTLVPPEEGELEVWARTHGVAGELLRPASEVLGPDVSPTLSLYDVWNGKAASRLQSLLRAGQGRPRVLEHLMSEAAREASLATREALWATAPLPQLRMLVERLRAVLVGTTPLALHGIVFVPARPVALDLETGVCEGHLHAHDGVVRARLLLSGHEQRAIDTQCSECTRERCVHVRALAGRVLDACLWRDDRLHGPVLELVRVPSWQRFLRALEPPGDANRDAAVKCVFDVTLEGEGASVAASMVRAGKRERPITASRALRELSVDDRDRAVLEAMAALQKNLGASKVAPDMTLWRALVEHPRVRIEGKHALRVLEQSVEVNLAEQPEGLLPKVTLAGASVPSGARGRGVTALFSHDRASGTLSVAPLTPALGRLLAALEHFRGVLPPESYATLAPMLSSLRQVARVASPKVLEGHEQPPPKKLLLRITPGLDQGVDVVLSTRPLPLGALWPPGRGPELVHGILEGKPAFTRRDLAWERETAEQVHAALSLSTFVRLEPFAHRVEDQQAALNLLSQAARLSDVLELEWAERAARMNILSTVRTGDLKVDLFKKGDWFTLTGRVKNPQAELAVGKLLDAVRTGDRFVRVSGQDFVEIEAELFARLEAAQQCLMEPTKEGGMPVEAASAWLAVFGEVSEAGDDETAAFLALVRAAQKPVPALDDARFLHLRQYQRDGVAWLLQRAQWARGVCMADEMGLGKTVQAVAVLRERAPLGPALVIAPTSVVDNWLSELARFAPELEAHGYTGRGRERLLTDAGAGTVIVTSYELLLRDGARFEGKRFATQVVDEAQVIKNARTLRARAVAGIAADFRIALSGTPVENRLADLWSLFELLSKGLLGSWPRFRARFAVPIERYENEERAEALRNLVAPFLLRRTKDDVLAELPQRTEVVHMVEFSPAEEELYASAVRHARLALGKRDKNRAERSVQILAELTRLRQLACHPRLVLPEERVQSSKLSALLVLLDDILPRGHRALLFSQFTAHLALVREALETRGIRQLYLDGSTPAGQRAELVRRFQEGEGQVFLISLKAGGTGLNLTAADYVVHLDPWWNPAVEDQASDRAHRIGQERPVTVVKLVTRETIEEKVLGLHGHKRRLADAVLLGEASPAELDVAALEALLD